MERIMEQVVFSRLVPEVYEWSHSNFGEQPSYRPLLGLVEEFGELLEALAHNDRAKIEDAIGDIAVFSMDYAAREKLDMLALDDLEYLGSQVAMNAVLNGPKDIVVEAMKYLGKINHAHLKSEQKIRVSEDHAKNKQFYLHKVTQAMYALSDMMGSDYAGIVNGTWAEVSKRQWKKNAVNGAVDAA